jgi:RNA-directed DNA polymerase
VKSLRPTLHAFDIWMKRTLPDLPWCRYADDGLVHCRSEQEAEAVKAMLQDRLAECQLEMHPTKTKIVYCRDSNRRRKYPNVAFDFLGYCFRPRRAKGRNGKLFCSFSPAISPTALKSMREKIRDLNIRRRTDVSMEELACKLNPILTGWMEYYGRYTPSALTPAWHYVNQVLCSWVMRKFKRFGKQRTRAGKLLERMARERVGFFAHWRGDPGDAFA